MKKNLLTLALSVAASVAASAQASYGEAIEMQVGQNSATIESELSDTAFFKYTAAEGMALTITANTGTMVAAQEIVAGGAAADTVDIDGVRTSDRETVYPAVQGRTIYICAIGVGEVGFTAAAEPAPGVGMGAQFAMVSPILAIDPIIDMPRTMLNVTGSLTNALVVDKHMGSLDEKAYNDMSLNKLESKKK